MAIRDLSGILEAPIPEAANKLHGVWDSNWQTIEDDVSGDAVEKELDNLRDLTLVMLEKLD